VAKICLARSASRVLLEVADNGRGMPEHLGRHAINEKPPMGVGITGMRERVERLNGQLEIESAGEKGRPCASPCPRGLAPGPSSEESYPRNPVAGVPGRRRDWMRYASGSLRSRRSILKQTHPAAMRIR
jgi:hypothetical protein